jgi:hypothetical protein
LDCIEERDIVFGKSSSIYKKWNSDWKKYKAIPEKIRIANLGSTCDANNYDYTFWDVIGFNFASAPQDVYYDNQVLEQYGSHLVEGAVVIIPLSEFALLVDKYETDYHNYKYYGYIEPNRILNYSKIKSILIRVAPGLLYTRLLTTEIKELLKKVVRRKVNLSRKRVGMKEQSKKMILAWMQEFGWNEGVKIRDEQHDTIERSWNLLMKDFSYCKKHNFQPVVVIPPFNENLKQLLPKNVLDDCLWKHVKKVEEMGVKVVNFWDDDELQKDCYFNTPICLNNKGKELFNSIVQEKVLK